MLTRRRRRWYFDSVELSDGTNPGDPNDRNADADNDGLSDLYETETLGTDPNSKDSDGDGVDDGQEAFGLDDRLVTNPLDADTDDDGLLDGEERGRDDRGATLGGTSPLLFDTDKDRLSDGQEVGLATPNLNAAGEDQTDPTIFKADSDPESRTNPTNKDSDGDGLTDGYEDRNRNGARSPTETDPSVYDTDNDGMDDGWEWSFSRGEACVEGQVEFLNPLDGSDGRRDIDDDGLTSLEEYQVLRIVDDEVVEQATNPCHPDTDGDGLLDGLELRSRYGTESTSPTNADSDGDGIPDGLEDSNADGLWDPDTETSPMNRDSDGDGLFDGEEDLNGDGIFGSDEPSPFIGDSDGDGLTDGQEVKATGTSPTKADTDGDGLFDPIELGLIDDLDPFSVTDPRERDTDGDGIADGAEDRNANGRVDEGELDPRRVDTDGDGLTDSMEDANRDGRFQPESRETDGAGGGYGRRWCR